MENFEVKVNDNFAITYQEKEDVKNAKHHWAHTHDFYEMYFFIGGECSYLVENRIFKLVPGTVVFTRPGELHSVIVNENCVYSRFFFQFRDEFLCIDKNAALRCFYDRPFGQNNSLVLPISMFENCVAKIKNNIELYINNSPNFELVSLIDFLQILKYVNDAFDVMNDNVENKRFSQLISDSLLYINDNLSQIRSTDEVAKALYVSREYLSRSFSREMGTTLNSYIMKKKIALSKSLLSQGYSATEVSIMSGFDNYSYFIQIFKKATGHTPGKWKKLDEQKVTLLI